MSATSAARSRSQTIMTPPAREPVGQTRQQRAADDRRQVGQRVDGARRERGVGPFVDEDGQRHLGELVTEQGKPLAEPERAELPDGDDLAVGRLAFRRHGDAVPGSRRVRMAPIGLRCA